jgi:hypothetical protein
MMRIRNPGWKKVGSGINIPDPQHCDEPYKIFLHCGQINHFYPLRSIAHLDPH